MLNAELAKLRTRSTSQVVRGKRWRGYQRMLAFAIAAVNERLIPMLA